MPAAPYQMVTIAAGMMAMARVTSRRIQGGRRMSRKPSITICPDSVAVTVEFSPQQSSAMANRVGAKAEPSSGARKRMHLLELGHVGLAGRWKVDAARIRIEALIRSANISAMVESMVASVIASRFSGTRPAVSARLHDARMQIEVMRHHRGADDAERQIQHRRVLDDLDRRREAADHLAPIGIGHGDLDAEAERR